MSVSPATTRAAARPRRPAAPRRRRLVFWIVGAVLAVLLAALAAASVAVFTKALTVRDVLTAAVPLASGLPAKIAANDVDGTAADAAALKRLTSEAVSETDDALWRLGEQVPFAGANLSAVRVAAESVDIVATYAVEVTPGLNLTAFQPVDGAIDLAAVHSLADAVASGQETFDGIEEELAGVDRGAVVPQVRDALETLDTAVERANGMLTTISPILDVLPAALGEGGTKTYLLLFQGNSELRASGGNPAAMALVTATDGKIALTTQATSVQFDNARAQSIAPLDPETEHIYSDIIGRWIPNMTATPDFPTTVAITKAWWADEGLPPFDAVISTDPIALSHLLTATGPIPLATGETLTSENAASLLLNEVYFTYGEGGDATAQDLFFAAAAAQVFSTLTSGISNPLAFVDALATSTEEGRLKIWSSDPAITDLVAGTKLAGTLPASNEDETIAGVYFNDTTGAKTDYYANAAVTATTDQCTAAGAPTFTQSIAFSNDITPEQAAALPYFITGRHYPPGTIATDVVIYSPVGGTIESWTVSGAASHTLITEGTHLGRDVVRISIVTPQQTTATIDVVMKGAEGVPAADYGPYDVWTTPMVRDTPVTVDAPGCSEPE